MHLFKTFLYFLFLAIACKSVSALLFFSAFWFYKAPKITPKENKVKEDNKAFVSDENGEAQSKQNGHVKLEPNYRDANNTTLNITPTEATHEITKL